VSSDESAVASLYPALYRFAAAVCPGEVDPDDLVQEAFVRTLRAGPLDRYDNPGAYLRRAIVNLAANQRRGFGRGRRAVLRLVPPADVAPAYPSDLSELLRLAPDDRAVLYLVHVEGLPYGEAAEVLGCSEEAARSRASRARRRLRADLAGEER
jgi:DNA-directed RNA polymerase specialized sigma24 family protein